MIKLTPEKPPYYENVGQTKTIIALITQTGTGDPTIQILQNTLNEIPTITRIDTGLYFITTTQTINPNYTTFQIQNNKDLQTQMAMYYTATNTIVITTGIANTPTDALLTKTPIKITLHI